MISSDMLYLLGLFRLRARGEMTMLVCYNYAENFSEQKYSSVTEEHLMSFGAQYGFKILRKKSVIFGATDYSIFFFEESARQTLVSTV